MGWPVALVVVAALAAITVLGLNHVDGNAITWVLIVVFGGLSANELKNLREQTNGTMTKLVDHAMRTPPAAPEEPPPPAE